VPVPGISHHQAADPFRKQPGEFLRDAVLDDEALGCHTALSSVEHSRADGFPCRCSHIRIVEDNKRVASAQFQDLLFQVTTGNARDLGRGNVAASITELQNLLLATPGTEEFLHKVAVLADGRPGPVVRHPVPAVGAAVRRRHHWALNLCAPAPGAFGASEIGRRALASRAVIDQALGIIMAQERCPSTHAFAVLRNASQNRNTKLRDIARQIAGRSRMGYLTGPLQRSRSLPMCCCSSISRCASLICSSGRIRSMIGRTPERARKA
jgi:hypothetical protein